MVTRRRLEQRHLIASPATSSSIRRAGLSSSSACQRAHRTALAPLCCGAAASGARPTRLLILAGFIGLYRLFQDYVLNPMLMSGGVAVPPLLILFGLLAGEELAGVAGIFLSVPVLAAAKIAILRIAQERRSAASLRAEATRDPGKQH